MISCCFSLSLLLCVACSLNRQKTRFQCVFNYYRMGGFNLVFFYFDLHGNGMNVSLRTIECTIVSCNEEISNVNDGDRVQDEHVTFYRSSV